MANVERVKQGLRDCDWGKTNCDGCAYRYQYLCSGNIVDCTADLTSDALSVIEELQEENKALRLLLDWAVECDFGYDQFFAEYQKYKHETEGLGYTEGMIKVARCVLAEKNS